MKANYLFPDKIRIDNKTKDQQKCASANTIIFWVTGMVPDKIYKSQHITHCLDTRWKNHGISIPVETKVTTTNQTNKQMTKWH